MTTENVTHPESYGDTARARARYLGPDFPAATGVIVKGLIGRSGLIEISAVTVKQT